MLRADFDSHSLWAVLDQIDQHLRAIVDDHQPEELPFVERIRMQLDYVRGFDVVASTRSAFFHPQMLIGVQSAWEPVNQALAQRVASGTSFSNYTQQAADQAETGLMQMAAWPRPYGKGGEVTQMNTLFEQLLESQRTSIDALNLEHASLRAEIVEYDTGVETKRDEATSKLSNVEAELKGLESVIESQKQEVSGAVQAAAAAVSELSTHNTEAYKAWVSERELTFESDFAPLRESMTKQVSSAEAEYDSLLTAKEKYTKLVSAIAADEVASQFELEAKWGRTSGTRFYVVGFALLAAAAIPLIWLIFESPSTGVVNWTVIITRLAIGILAGSAATVAIRLGSRLINNANAIKRMELELRAIGPFLANISEKPKVDDAFIDLVTKAFGNTYAETKSTGGTSKDGAEENTSVTAISQALELLEKLRRAVPPTST